MTSSPCRSSQQVHTTDPNHSCSTVLVHYFLLTRPFGTNLKYKGPTLTTIARELTTLSMCGQCFSKDLRWAIIHAEYHGLDPTATAALTGVSEQQVQRMHDCYSWTGDVQMLHDQWGTETQGRNPQLNVEHQHVSWLYATCHGCSLVSLVHQVLYYQKLFHLHCVRANCLATYK